MSWTDIFDPTSKNFLGMGERFGRIAGALATANTTEFHRSDPFFSKQGTGLNRWGRSVGGSGPGAVGGFITGGPYGAVAGGLAGGLATDQGLSNNTSAQGFGKNFGLGLGAGAVTGYGAGALSGGQSGGWAGSLAAPSAAGSGGTGAVASTPYSRGFSMAQGMGPQQQQPAAQTDQQSMLEKIYQLYPQLRPGAKGKY